MKHGAATTFRRNARGIAREAALKELRTLPGVGKKIARTLWDLGIRSIRDLRDRDPDDLYRRQCDLEQARVDRCALYVYRCIVYYASSETHAPELLKWWNWKDRPGTRS